MANGTVVALTLHLHSIGHGSPGLVVVQEEAARGVELLVENKIKKRLDLL